jgi:hypothetical protein
LVKEPEGKKPFGRPKSRCEDNIWMNLREMWWEVVNRMHMAQDRDQWRALVNTITNLRVPKKAGNFLTSWVTVSFSRTVLHAVSFWLKEFLYKDDKHNGVERCEKEHKFYTCSKTKATLVVVTTECGVCSNLSVTEVATAVETLQACYRQDFRSPCNQPTN